MAYVDLDAIRAKMAATPEASNHTSIKFETHLKGLVGSVYALDRAAQTLGYQRTPGMGACKIVFAT